MKRKKPYFSDVETSGVCATPQHLNLGIIGTIQCSFRENFYGVYWYSSTDSANTYPLLTFQESEKGGDGYLSGEFDVFPNGSLIIKNVSLRDDHIFRVILLDSKDVDSVIHDIRVYVTGEDSSHFLDGTLKNSFYQEI